MFKFLKEKLKQAVKKFSKDVEEKAEEVEETVQDEAEKKPIKEKPKPTPQKASPKKEAEKPEPKPAPKEEKSEPAKEKPKPVKEEKTKPEPAEEKPKEMKKGFFAKIKDSFTKKVEERPEEGTKPAPKEEKKPEQKKETPKPEPVKEPEPKKEESEPIKEEPAPVEEKGPEPVKEEPQPEPVKEKEPEPEPIKEEPKPEPEEKKGMFGFIKDKLTKKTLSSEKFEELFYDIELALLENNVAMDVIEKIKTDLREELVDKPLPRGEIETKVLDAMTDSIRSLFDVEQIDIEGRMKDKKPYVICFFGINGAGKTTTIAKVAHHLTEKGHKVVLAAADTFRAAAIDQIQLHADRLGVKLIKHDYGADAAAVAFDAVKHAEAKRIDAVLIDTAGRMHSNVNLQDELKKIVRVAKPDLKVFVGEAITGNDCVEQAAKFNETVGIDAIILTKTDVDEKGGAFVSVTHVTGAPIIFMGVGQEYADLKPFDKEEVLQNLGLT